MDTLTNPPSPIIVGGETYQWRPEGDSGSVRITTDADAALVFLANLGEVFPGQDEAGANVLWTISTVHPVPEGADVILTPNHSIPGANTRIQLAVPLGEGSVVTETAVKGLEGQWLTILIGGQMILGQIVEAETVPDGRQVDIIVDTPWPGLVLQEPEAE